MHVDEHTITFDGSPVFYRSAPSASPAVAPVFLHGIPTSSDDWTGILERTGGLAPDLLGFGRSGKGGHLDYSLTGLAAFVERLLDEQELNGVALVGHDWGAAVALTVAARAPGRVNRLVLVNPVAPIPTLHWSSIARAWRRPIAGELTMGATTKALLARQLRRASGDPATWPSARVDAVWQQFDQGTQRAILRLHRATNTPVLVATMTALADITAPALILVGVRDPWLEARDVAELADRLPDARIARFQNAGHWPWLDDPAAAQAIEDALR